MINNNTTDICTKEVQPVLTYDGQLDHDRYLQWTHRISQAHQVFADLFNSHMDEVLGSKTPYNQKWMIDFHTGKAWEKLETLTEEFVKNQNKATRDHFTAYYVNCIQDLKEAWKAYMLVYNSYKPGTGQKALPLHLIRPENLPFKNGNIEYNLEKIDAVRNDFNEYLTDPDLIAFYNNLITVRDSYRVLEAESKRLDLKFDLQPVMGGVPFYLYKDSTGIWQLKNENLKYALTLKNH